MREETDNCKSQDRLSKMFASLLCVQENCSHRGCVQTEHHLMQNHLTTPHELQRSEKPAH